MYDYVTSFLLIFLTHPGVAYNWFEPGVFGGLFQAVVISILQSPSDMSASFATTMSIIYWVMLLVWAYVKVQLALKGA